MQDQLARYGLDRLRGVEIDELAGIGHHFDDPEDVERVAATMDAWLAQTGSAVDVDPVRFLDDVAAVDDERLPRDVAGLLAGQERDRRGDLAARPARPTGVERPAVSSCSVDDAVAIQPGCTELAVTPPRPQSCASARIIPSTAALAVE